MITYFVSLLFALQVVACLSRQTNFSVVHESTKELIQYISNGYDKTMIPNNSGGLPLNIMIDIYIITMEPIDQITMKFTMQMYFRQYWKDESLQFKRSNASCTEYISLNPEIISKVWIPDTYIENEVSKDVRSRALVIWPNGLVLLSERVNIQSYCPLDLRMHPMDVQECTLKLQSYSYAACELQYSWFYEDEGMSLRLAKSITLPNYDISDLQTYTEMDNLKTGSFSRVLAKIQFKHKIMFIIMRDYLPAAFIVVTSWLSFHINPASSPARVSLAVITVLSISTQLSSSFRSTPEVSYVKAIDWYLLVCFLFVFAAMIEYGFIHRYGEHTTRVGTSNTEAKHAKHGGDVNAAFEEFENGEVKGKVKKGEFDWYRSKYRSNVSTNVGINNGVHLDNQDRSKESGKINWARLLSSYHGIPCADAISRIAFPILFLSFNVIYWALIFMSEQ